VARILFNTFGSYGDLHPYMAIGIELQQRGHQVTIATSIFYKAKVESEGLRFHAVRPDVDPLDRKLIEHIMDAKHGSERVIRFVTDRVRESYEDLLPAAREADLIAVHPVTYAAGMVAEKLGVPWVSTTLAPTLYFSCYDPPVYAPAPWAARLNIFGPKFIEWIFRPARKMSLRWVQPVLDLRRELGLPPRGHPLFEGWRSPKLDLALFSRCLAEPQPDWPPQAEITGFPFFDRHHEQQGLSGELKRFLDSGPAPVVFTLGTSAVGAPGNFYRESLRAVERIGVRAVFLTGQHPQGLPDPLPDGVIAADYAPHSDLFPRAAAIVHQGGIGTTAQALRSGQPMLVVPYGHDQFDNGARARRLGAGEVLYSSRYNCFRAAVNLRRLISQPSYRASAAVVAKRIAAENGTVTAADALEEFLLTAG
jgi:rhamnosyltransferase subunit B